MNIEKIKVIDRRAAATAARRLQANVEALNDYCSKLKAIDDIFPLESIAGVKKVSGEWLKKYIAGVTASISEDTRLPSTFKKELASRWQRVYDEAHELCDKVHLIANFEGVPLHRRGGRFCYSQADVDAFAADGATIELDDEQTAYLSLLGNVAKSLNDIGAWERAHGYLNTSYSGADMRTDAGTRHISLLDLLLIDDAGTGRYGITPEAFVSFLADGVIGKGAQR